MASSEAECSGSKPKKVKKNYENHINFTTLIHETITQEKTIEFCQKYTLIPKSVNCSKCGDVLEKIFFNNNSGFFRCNKRSCKVKQYITSNTWFEGRKISLEKTLVLTYCFFVKASYEFCIRETSGTHYGDKETSTETVSDTYSYCREVCSQILAKDGDTVVGGPNCIVEIDEAKFGKRKYNRGRLVEGTWVFGGICRETKECFFVPLPDHGRTEESLLGLISKHIKPGSIVHSDCFSSYQNLEEKLGHKHLTVNHSENFVDPITGCHTNTIESTWWSVKRSLRSSHTRRENFGDHLAEYIYFKKTAGDNQFAQFLYDIGRIYPGI